MAYSSPFERGQVIEYRYLVLRFIYKVLTPEEVFSNHSIAAGVLQQVSSLLYWHLQMQI